MPLDPLITGPNTILIEYEEDPLSDLVFGPGDWLPDNLEIAIIYKGTVDGTNVGKFIVCTNCYFTNYIMN